jgi:hypothetical protein
MIDRCFNPACNKQIRYLREGRVVRVVRDGANEPGIEHYWLCGMCFQSHDFIFRDDGTITLGERFHTFIHADVPYIAA